MASMGSGTPADELHPEHALIDVLCFRALPQFSINDSLLREWQVELSDVASDLTVLATAVLLEILLRIPTSDTRIERSNRDELLALLTDLQKLDDAVYGDFVLIVLETVRQAITRLTAVALQWLHLDVISGLTLDLMAWAQNGGSAVPCYYENVWQIKMQTLRLFLEIDCPVWVVKTFASSLFSRASSVETRTKMLQNLGSAARDSLPKHTFLLLSDFRDHPVSIPLAPNSAPPKCFTVQAWIRINEVSELEDDDLVVTTLFGLSHAGEDSPPVFKIQLLNRKILVELHNPTTKSRSQFTFNQSLDSLLARFVHFTLTYDEYKTLNLFIDGEYLELIPFSALAKDCPFFNKLYLYFQSEVRSDRQELLVKDLQVFNRAIPHEWVTLFHCLGLGYDWSCNDLEVPNIGSFLSHMSPAGRLRMALRVAEVEGDKTKIGRSAILSDTDVISRLLRRTRLKQSQVIFDSSDPDFTSSVRNAGNPQIVVHSTNPITSAINVLGGAAFLLSITETILKELHDTQSERSVLLIEAIELLVCSLKADWRLNTDFENCNGPAILLLLLAHYKTKFDHDLHFESSILDKFLDYCVLDTAVPVIASPHAYPLLVANFDLYAGTCEWLKLNNHLKDLTRPSKYQAHNLRELSNMQILRLLLQHIKLETIQFNSGENLDAAIETLDSIIHSSLTVDAIRALSQYVIFALYENSENIAAAETGRSILRSLTGDLCKKSASVKVLKKFLRSITIHWILLLLDFESPSSEVASDVVQCGLTLLVRLLHVLGPHVVRRFFQTNRGVTVLTHFLSRWWCRSEITNLVFLSSLDVDIPAGIQNRSLAELLKETPVMAARAPLPELLLLYNNLCLHGMYLLSSKCGKVLSVPSSPRRPAQAKFADLAEAIFVDPEILEISLNVVHLVSLYADAIEAASEIPSLVPILRSTEWLEGIFELVAYLKISTAWKNLELEHLLAAHERMLDVLSTIFILRLPDAKAVLSMILSLDDITAKLVLDSVFVRLFRHAQAVLEGQFVHREQQYVDGMSEIISFYDKHFLSENYYVSSSHLDPYIECLAAVLEAGGRSKTDLGGALGRAIVWQFQSIGLDPRHHLLRKTSDTDVLVDSVIDGLPRSRRLFGSDNQKLSLPSHQESSPPTPIAAALSKVLHFLLYRQMVTLLAIVPDEAVLTFVELAIGHYLRLAKLDQQFLSEQLFSFLRTVVMIRDTFAHKSSTLGHTEQDARAVEDFFVGITTRNDEDVARLLYRDLSLRNVFTALFHKLIGNSQNDTNKVRVIDMVRVTMANGGRLGHMENAQISNFSKDSLVLCRQMVRAEAIKYNRELQDRQERARDLGVGLEALLLEAFRLVGELEPKHYLLDYLEGVDRQRKLLVVEDSSQAEDFTYTMAVPIRQIIENGDTAEISNETFEDLSVSEMFESGGFWNTSELADLHAAEEEDGASPSDDRNRKVLRSLLPGDHIVCLWNVTRINGLDAVENLMILGSQALYLIENYVHCADGNVVESQDAPPELKDPYLQLIKPAGGSEPSAMHRVKTWPLETLLALLKRQFLLRDQALEVFFDSGASILVTCINQRLRDTVHGRLAPLAARNSSHRAEDSASSSDLLSTKLAYAFAGFPGSKTLAATRKWRSGEISNFSYLMTVNTAAGRTFNDLSQYPVFPWVIADYESKELDLLDPKTFRDFSKPMGAQTNARAELFRERYDALGSLHDPQAPPFHYGTHYLSAMIVALYLIRLKPYVQSYLLLQGGKFDHADRLFSSIGKAWSSAAKDNSTDVRELTPEFFFLPEFLVNSNNFEFGRLHGGTLVNDVELPPWAKGDPKIFIEKNREALESPYVSRNLHHWIDLVFGFKQSGPEAVKALNVFHHLSYNGAVDLDNIKDDVEKRAVIGMINNFGQTPSRVFPKPHPSREVLNVPYMEEPPQSTWTLERVFESKLRLPIYKLELSSKTGKWIGRPACASSEDELRIRKPHLGRDTPGAAGALVINATLFLNLSPADISVVAQIGGNQILTGTTDGVIMAWKWTSKPAPALTCQGTMRGHVAPVLDLVLCKPFNVCLSLDSSGVALLWDLSRFKYVRRIECGAGSDPTHSRRNSDLGPRTDGPRVLAAISDTGTICLVHSTRFANTMTIFSLNGSRVAEVTLDPGYVTCALFVTPTRHSYLGRELVALAYSRPHRSVQIYEVRACAARRWGQVPLEGHVTAAVTTVAATATVASDYDKLARALLTVVVGDASGAVTECS